MSELSRSLVDAAAPYVEGAADVDYPTPVDRATRAAVAAVLEALAAELGKDPVELMDLIGHGKAYNEGKSYVIDRVRRLAVEAREDTP